MSADLSTVEDHYQAKCSNSYDNKCILLTALRGYLKEREDGDVLLEKNPGAELDAAAILAFLVDQASKAGDAEEANRIKALDDAALVRSGTWGSLWLDGEQVAECYGCQIKLSKTKEDVTRCRTLVAGKKLTGISGTGTVRIYNATSRLIQAEAQALKNGQDLRHTLISNLDDPDNPSNQRISVTGVSFDDLTLADWEAAKLGQIEAPFTFEDFDVLDS